MKLLEDLRDSEIDPKEVLKNQARLKSNLKAHSQVWNNFWQLKAL